MKEDNVLSNLNDVAADAAAIGTLDMAITETATSQDRLDNILKSLEEEKAEDVLTIPLSGKSQMADFMVIASGRSSRQVTALSGIIADNLKADLGVISKTEGKNAGDWVLIDCGDVIVHIFRPEVREFYQLEKMWAAPSSEHSVS